MSRTTDSQTVDLIESNRLILEATRGLIVRSKRECEKLRATMRQSRRLVDEINSADQSRQSAK